MASAEGLLGRHGERERVRALLGHARNGRGGALLVTGEPGIGKTTLLDATTSDQAGLRLLRVDGFEAESTIPFAGVQRLMIPLRGTSRSFPRATSQRCGWRPAWRRASRPTASWWVSACWASSAPPARSNPCCARSTTPTCSTPSRWRSLAFVARRLEAESAALRVRRAATTAHSTTQLAGVPGLPLAGLERSRGLRLLLAVVPEPIDPAAAAQIATATGGNPLALSTWPGAERTATHRGRASPTSRCRSATTSRRSTCAGSATSPRTSSLAAGGRRRLHRQRRPDPVRRPGSWGVPDVPCEEAESAGLVSSAGTVRFRHPLVRSAVYNAAPGPRPGGACTARCRWPRPQTSRWWSSRPGTPPRRRSAPTPTSPTGSSGSPT